MVIMGKDGDDDNVKVPIKNITAMPVFTVWRQKLWWW